MFFDDTLRLSLLSKYGSGLATYRPEHYALATDPAREQQRAWVNRALEQLGGRGAETLFHNLETRGRFLQSYNELAIAAILQGAGGSLAYERRLESKTPDFVVLDPSDRITHIIEVVNQKRPKPADATDKRWRELSDRFARVEQPWRLRVANQPHIQGGPAPDLAKYMVNEIGRLLASEPVRVGDLLANDAYSFLVVAPSPGTHVELLTPVEEVWVDSDTLASGIRDKVSRYADLANQLDVPLIVVVGADDTLAVSADFVRSALGGPLTLALNLNPFGVGTGSTKSRSLRMHATDAPRVWNSALSAVGWLQAGIDIPGTIDLFPYDKAARYHGVLPTPQIRAR